MDSFRIESGTAHVWFAYDLGHQIDLDRAEQRCSARAERELIKHEHREPAYLQFRPAPLRVVEPCPAVEIGGFAWQVVERNERGDGQPGEVGDVLVEAPRMPAGADDDH